MDILPRMIEIVRIVVSNEENVPVCCQACRFSDKYLYGGWFCVNGRQIDFPRAKPDWCPIVTVESLKLKAER